MLNVEDLVNVGWSKPHPIDNSILLPGMMCLAASRDGHRVMLHGMGGDFSMAIHDRYIGYLLQQRQLCAAIRESHALSKRYNQGQYHHSLKYLLQHGWTAFGPKPAKKALFKWRNRQFRSQLRGSLIEPDVAKRLQVETKILNHNRSGALARLEHQTDLIRLYSPPYGYVAGLNGLNRVAGRFGLELRDPWSDKEVAEFCLYLPVKYKTRNGWPKYLARTSFAEDLDESVRWRRGKQHLGFEFIVRLMQESVELADQKLSPNILSKSGYMDSTRQLDWQIDAQSDSNGFAWHTPYDILTIILWLERLESQNQASKRHSKV
jgi:asparagine synthase (glutamine-hydrolysing)